jgi:ABC-type nickel/cobalt efflux system permease component RcnA
MAIGKITLVTPIVGAHPVFIVVFSNISGTVLAMSQLIAIAIVIAGVGVVGATGREVDSANSSKKYASTKLIICISLISSLFYAGAIIALQQAGQYLTESNTTGKAGGLFL